ncbi:MAG: pinensin family lanthipeptide [Cyclobacteriaceae bacterium]
MKAKKLKLSELEISSFVTAIEKDVKAGAIAREPGQELQPDDTVIGESGYHTCKSHLHTECCTFPGC